MNQAYERLEEEWGRWACVSNVVACSSGTAALHLALEALRLPLGSEVIVPDFTMVACARAVILAGLTPVFVDCKDDLTLDETLLDDCIHGQVDSYGATAGYPVRAVMPVHVYGRSCNMPAVMDFARKYDLYVVEDLAEAHGLPPHPGTDAACWSFYKNKVIAGEEGGAVAFATEDTARVARQLRSLGFTDAHDFYHVPRGHNYRLANALAELVLLSLVGDVQEEGGYIQKYWRYALSYRRQLEAAYDDECPDGWRMPDRAVPWVYDVKLPMLSWHGQDYSGPVTGLDVVRELNREGIAARCSFKPMHCLEEFKRFRCVAKKGITCRSYEMSRQVIYLPLTPGLDPGVAERAFEVIRRVVS